MVDFGPKQRLVTFSIASVGKFVIADQEVLIFLYKIMKLFKIFVINEFHHHFLHALKHQKRHFSEF